MAPRDMPCDRRAFDWSHRKAQAPEALLVRVCRSRGLLSGLRAARRACRNAVISFRFKLLRTRSGGMPLRVSSFHATGCELPLVRALNLAICALGKIGSKL